MRRLVVCSAAALVAMSFATLSFAQTSKKKAAAPPAKEQAVIPPKARYWMGVSTGAGLSALSAMMPQSKPGEQPSIGDMLKMSMRGMPSESHNLELKLGSSLSPADGGPQAFHTMPPGAKVNKPIFLYTPEPTTSSGPPTEGSRAPTAYKQPKGQISFYWGCGEKAGPGQPVVLSFDKLVRGANDPELKELQSTVSARTVRKPSVSDSTTYGDWPNSDPKNKNKGLDAKFPTGSTLAGQHVIEGTYTPKIDFTLDDNQSFMDAVRYSENTVLPSGAIKVSWNAINRATGYSLGVMAPERMNDDSANMIMWSSANRPATFIQMEDLAPSEVKRLIAAKAVLPPETTTCTVPTEVIKATQQGSMLMFTAFGDEATFVSPERPTDPRVPWEQDWFARVMFKSTRMDLVSPQGVQDMSAMMASGGGPGRQMTDDEYCRALAANRKPSAAEMIGRASGLPGGGLLGRALGAKKQDEPTDPRCVKK